MCVWRDILANIKSVVLSLVSYVYFIQTTWVQFSTFKIRLIQLSTKMFHPRHHSLAYATSRWYIYSFIVIGLVYETYCPLKSIYMGTDLLHCIAPSIWDSRRISWCSLIAHIRVECFHEPFSNVLRRGNLLPPVSCW